MYTSMLIHIGPLAFLTNQGDIPSKAYLTERAFRKDLARLTLPDRQPRNANNPSWEAHPHPNHSTSVP